jgi:hypothetical protein
LGACLGTVNDLNGLATKAARPTDYTILIRFNRVKVFSMAWDKTRTSIFILKPGNWQRYLSPTVPNVGLHRHGELG